MRRAGVLAASICLALSVVACGGDSGGGGGGGGDTIKIGASVSKTGVYAASADFALKGYQLWVDQQNAKGGLNGKKLELDVLDDKSDPGTAVRLYTKLISQDQVDMLVGPYSSGISQAVAPVAEKFKKPMIDTQAAAEEIFQGTKYNLQGIEPASKYLVDVPKIAKDAGYDRFALLINNTPATKAICKSVNDQAKKLGMQVVYSKSFPKDQTDFSSLVLGAKQAKAQIMIGCTYVEDAIGVAREISQQGLAPKLTAMSIGPVEPTFGKSLGKLANGVIGSTSYWPTLPTEGNEAFVAAYRKKYGEDPDYHAAAAYAGMQTMGAAVGKAGGVDDEKVNQALHSLEMKTVQGTYKVTAEGLQVGYGGSLMQWIDGDAKLVFPADVAETKPQLTGK